MPILKSWASWFGQRKKCRRSISRVLSRAAISLRKRLPASFSSLPGGSASRVNASCQTLLPMGFARPMRLRTAGALLTRHFTVACPKAGCVISVALSVGSPRPAVSRHRCSMKPGLSSRSRRSAFQRPHNLLLSDCTGNSANREGRTIINQRISSSKLN